MAILSTNPQEIAERIDAGTAAEVWRDWRWQVRHAVTDISTFERLLGVSFDADERRALEETVSRFSLRITPYDLSLTDAGLPRGRERRDDLLRRPPDLPGQKPLPPPPRPDGGGDAGGRDQDRLHHRPGALLSHQRHVRPGPVLH